MRWETYLDAKGVKQKIASIINRSTMMSEANKNQSLPYTSLNTTYMNLSKDFSHYITITLPETIFS